MQKYEIIINPKLLKQLEKDIWMNEHVPAVLKLEGKQYTIGLAYRGNVLRKKIKKSYNIVFQKPFTMNGAHEIHLNAEFSDISLSRNKLSLDFFDQIGVITPHSKHVLLYINGICQGIYLNLESFDRFLLRKRKLPLGPIIYATNYHANFSLLTPENKLKTSLIEGYTIKYGQKKDIRVLENMIAMTNTLSNERFEEEIPLVMDIEKYFKWLSGVVCTQNYDGFIHNYALYQNGDTGKFEMTPWDYDGTWGRDLHGKKIAYDYVPITGYNTLTGRLLHLPKFSSLYREILSSILEKEFTTECQMERVEQVLNDLKPYISLDLYLTTSLEEFEKEKDVFHRFITNRNSYLRQELKQLQSKI
ncbi:CotH kinase family protein [Neobacillus sp. LXY-1]|uniref:CotH kinase family protein n=1 Tax=Neobacillus sp. LXY-1 TaxID=3379133 RepID=UPI003EE2DF24